MDRYHTPSPALRDAGVGRLRSLTVASAVAGVAAVVTFGTAAAISNPGHQASSGATGTSSTTGTGAGTTGTTDGATVTPTPTPDQQTTFFQAPAQVPGFIAGGGQSTTGGS